LLAAMGDPNAVDELALALDDSFWTVNESFTRNQISHDELTALKRLNDCLNRMSGEDHAELWTPASLASGDEWSEVRRLATRAILSRQISRIQRGYRPRIGRSLLTDRAVSDDKKSTGGGT